MSATAVQCGKCRTPVPDTYYNNAGFLPCPACRTPLHAEIFPALYRSRPAAFAGQKLLTDEEASCFYHPEKQAALPCDECGRFLCALCDCEIQGRHLCPNCLDTAQQKHLIKDLETRRVLYDKIALALAIYPLIFFYATLITAPAALYISIRHWKSPGSIIPRTKTRFVIAIILSLLQILGWIAGFTALFFAIYNR